MESFRKWSLLQNLRFNIVMWQCIHLKKTCLLKDWEHFKITVKDFMEGFTGSRRLISQDVNSEKLLYINIWGCCWNSRINKLVKIFIQGHLSSFSVHSRKGAINPLFSLSTPLLRHKGAVFKINITWMQKKLMLICYRENF